MILDVKVYIMIAYVKVALPTYIRLVILKLDYLAVVYIGEEEKSLHLGIPFITELSYGALFALLANQYTFNLCTTYNIDYNFKTNKNFRVCL